MSLLLGAPWAVSAQDAGRDRYAEAPARSSETPREERSAPSPGDQGETLSGNFELAEPFEQVRQSVDQAIRQAVSRMAFLQRSFGASRLRQTNPIRRTMRTEVRGGNVTIAYGDARYTTPDGEWRNVRDLQGNPVRVRQSVEGDTIEQTFSSPDGEKRTVYQFTENGDRVTLEVTVTSDRLPEPLRYTIPYRRAGSGEGVASR
jgi:hypothetical protein